MNDTQPARRKRLTDCSWSRTFMNLRDHEQSVNRFRLAGCVSFIDNNSFYGDVLTQSLGLVGKIVKVDFR